MSDKPSPIQKFRKRPIVIEAIQWTGNNFGDAAKLSEDIYGPYGKEECRIAIHTLDGRMNANPGDWIIKGATGEVYLCKDEIFRKTYESVFEGELDISHSLDEDFAHFLSNSGLTRETPAKRSMMRRAFEAGRNGYLR